MINLVLNSSPFTEDRDLNPANHYIDTISKLWGDKPNVLYIASFPDLYDLTDEYYNAFINGYKKAGFKFNINLLDNRNLDEFDSLFSKTDIIILPGGHTPTQMNFINKLHLKEKLASFNGLIIGTSAGSMNMANIVYAPPELEGEAINPNYNKFFDGLGLTDINIIPHYSYFKDSVVDGINVFSEIVLKDSDKHKFYSFSDGSYITIVDGKTTLYGEVFLINNKEISKISNNNDIIIL